MPTIRLLLLLTVLLPLSALAQPWPPVPSPLYDDTVIPSVFITIDPDSLAVIYDPDSLESDYEYPANFVFDNGTVRDSVGMIGFRLRGNTSRFSAKKSFKVSFNTFVPGRKLYGVEKMNLNGEHNDPSIIRAKLSWDLFGRAGVPAPRANHVRVYINGAYYGLYINVEHIDEEFALSRFGNNTGNLYKCLWPADLTYLGADPNLYKFVVDGRRTYELKTNEDLDDYSDLAGFIAALNLTPDSTFALEIQRRFDVNRYLAILAVDVATGSWDDYWFLKNNYYLYNNPATGKFEFIPYDYDNTFGIWWDGILPGVDWAVRSPYTWGHPSEPRPLAVRILNVPLFRDRFSFYLNRLLQEEFTSVTLFPRIDSIHAAITPAAEADLYRTYDYGFTIQNFHDSYTTALGGHVTHGVKPYITARRSSAFGQIVLNPIAPIISNVAAAPRTPGPGIPVTVTTRVEDDAPGPAAALHHRVNGVWRALIPLQDDGLHGDGAAGDGVYGAACGPFAAGDHVEYYLRAEDSESRLTLEPPDAPASLFRFVVPAAAGGLVVNEFMAKNDSTITDPFGEYEDWIEIFNAGTTDVRLGGYTLTDRLTIPTKWAFPDSLLPAGSYLVIWADEDGSQGPFHANFKLSRDGEAIGLFRSDSSGVVPVDTFSFGYQPSEMSSGRVPDAGASWEFMDLPTPGAPNMADRTVAVQAGWNIVALAVDPPDRSVGSLFAGALGSAYRYIPGGGYVPEDTLDAGRGYWLKFPAGGSVGMTGRALEPDTVTVVAGWNLIGGASVPVPAVSVVQVPPGIIASSFYRFGDGYVVADTLLPGGGYWVKCASAGVLVLR